MPAVSVLMPAYRAGETIGRAVASVIAQSFEDWEVVIASDDGLDYRALLEAGGVADERLRQVSTGRVGSGDAHARTIALDAATGEWIACLDADDAYDPARLATLLALAREGGAATDNTAVHYDPDTVRKLPFPEAEGVFALEAEDILFPRIPLFPVFHRDLAGAGWTPVAFAADVLFNLELLRRAERYVASPRPLYRYYKTPGSMTQSEGTARLADKGYDEIIALLRGGALDLDDAVRAKALAEFSENKVLNRLFERYRRDGRCRSLDEFLDLTENGRAAWLRPELDEVRGDRPFETRPGGRSSG